MNDAPISNPILPTLDLPTSRKSQNPFSLPPEAFHFQYREDQLQQQLSARRQERQKSLVARVKEMHSRIPPLVSGASTVRSARVVPQDRNIPVAPPQEPSTARPNNPRKMNTQEFIQQKREIFRVQLVLDKKAREIRRMDNDITKEEEQYMRKSDLIDETESQYKRTTNELEQKLNQARLHLETTTKRRGEKAKKLKLETQSVGVLHADILKNQDTLDTFRVYSDFLVDMTPEGKETMQYFVEPSVLIADLDEIESQNRFLMEQFERMDRISTQRAAVADVEMGKLNADFTDIENRAAKVEEIEHIPEVELDTSAIDQELHELEVLVRHVYGKCFGTGGNISTLGMLERLENSFEDLFDELRLVDPEFVRRKQWRKALERREEERKEKAAAFEQEQRNKVELALARATKPIKRKVGRPIYERSVPRRKKPRDDDKERAKKLEQERLDELLYADLA